MRRLVLASHLLLGFLFVAPASVGADSITPVEVTIAPTQSTVALGDTLEVTVRVANPLAATTPPLVVHLDITDPTASGSVDPEDWTSTLSQPTAEIAAGQSTTLTWELQPISPGQFSVYAVVLSAESDTLVPSTVLTVRVTEARSLNPGGILPVALGAPLVIGALLVGQTIRGRRVGHNRD
jgi:uncharacterized protein (DUF58 family)